MCVGGNSANTDRKATLSGYGSTENAITRLGKRAGILNSAGDQDTGRAAKHYSDILSGNPTAVMEAAAPEINAITKEGDQQKKEISQFGNRTGGTNAITQNLATSERGQIADVISGKREAAAAGEAQIGESEQAKGLTALDETGKMGLGLSEISGKNRQISQQIHDAAVKQWTDLIKEAFAFAAG